MAASDVPRPATIHDVARVAGVSHQTVSRYLRFNGGLKPATAEAIAAAVAQLDYRPNLIARSMRTRRTGRLAVLLPAAGAHLPSRLVAGALAVARGEGYVVEVLSLEGGMQARADRARELAASGEVEGILAFAPLPDDVIGTQRGTAIVASGELDDGMRTMGGLADGAPVAALVSHLAGLGHRRFLHITGDLGYASARARLAVYREVIDRLDLESVGVHEGDWSAQSGRDAVDALAAGHGDAPRATAIIAANDVVAAAAIRRALERGWRTPEDLSVTGWDDHVLGDLLSPRLTTVDADHERLGGEAAARLIAAVRGEDAPAASVDGVHRVIWRDSTGPAPAE